MQDGPSCCLDALQAAALWLCASGKQRDSNTSSISAFEWEVRERESRAEQQDAKSEKPDAEINNRVCPETEMMKSNEDRLEDGERDVGK